MNISLEVVALSVGAGIIILNLGYFIAALIKRRAAREKVKEIEKKHLKMLETIRRHQGK